MPYDVRALANMIMEIAESQMSAVSNLSLNKILYFIHAAYLEEKQKSLTDAKIEAWDHGPVFREIYHQFKTFGRNSISGRARRIDPRTGHFVEVAIDLSIEDREFVRRHAETLLKISPGKLVDMSHVRDGPWYTARFGNGRLNPGVEITSELILACSKQQARH